MDPIIIAKLINNATNKVIFETPLPLFVPLKVGERRDFTRFSFSPDDLQKNPTLQTDTLYVTRKALINEQEGFEIVGQKSKQYVVSYTDGFRIEVESYERPNGEIWVSHGSDQRYPKELGIEKNYEYQGRTFKLIGDCDLSIGGKIFKCILITFTSPNTVINYYVNKNGTAILKMNYHSKGHTMYEKGSFKRGVTFEDEHYSLIYYTMLQSLTAGQ